jgi:AcrR family transcriptional regulator
MVRMHASASRRGAILEAMVQVLCEQGYADTTVTEVCARAGVARGTFYEVFAGLRECMLAVIDDGYEQARGLIERAFAQQERSEDALRAALCSLLVFFDSEPQLTRAWFVETLGAGSWALDRRERHIAELTEMIVSSWPLPAGAPANPLAAMGVMESLVGVIRAHVIAASPEPLIELLGPMMGIVTAPYLDPPSVQREIELGKRHAQRVRAQGHDREHTLRHEGENGDGGVPIPRLLRQRRAHRARLCLLYVARHPGVSNQEVGDGIGISHTGQLARLLGGLASLDLLAKHTGGPGRPNAWSATPAGEQVALALTGKRSGPAVFIASNQNRILA